MSQRNRGLSGAGVLLVAAGAVVGLGAWLVAIYALPSSTTNANSAKLPALAIDPLAAGGSSSSSATSGGTSSSSTGTTSAGTQSAASGGGFTAGFTDLPFPPQNPTSKTLLATSMPGYQLFMNTCAGCHGQSLEGSVGPELRGIGNVTTSAKLGAFITTGKGMMPPNGGLSSPAQVQQVADWLAKQTQK